MVTPTTANGAFIQGCFSLIQEQIEQHINVLGGVSIAVISIMVSNSCPVFENMFIYIEEFIYLCKNCKL